jgi:outer membrane receptor protein involved in Fe transport
VDQTFEQSGDGLLNGGPSYVRNTSSDRGATPKYTLQYQASPDSMVYATVSSAIAPAARTTRRRPRCAARKWRAWA